VLQYGANTGRFGVYVAGRALDEDGWRQFSPDAVRQVYTDLGYHGRSLALDLSFTGADNRLSGESPAPLQELAVSQSLVFTNPQNNVNKLVFVTLNGEYEWTGSISIDGNLYYRDYQQSVVNGNTTDDAACTSPAYSGFLCQSGGATPLTNAAGALLPDISQGGTVYIGEKDFESIHSIGVGGSLQVTDTHALFGHDNHLALGATLDHDRTEFGSSAEIGVINAALAVTNSGLYVDTPEGLPWTATPVSLEATNRYYGAFGTDTLNVTPNLSVTASGRYNLALIDLADRRGAALSGRNRFSRFNPALGLAQKLSHHLTAYAGYSENSRTPTPSEIECANPAAPCLLPSSLSSDPPTLRQVVAHTWEAGVRGRISWPAANRRIFSWNLDLFRTEVADDIYGVATSLSAGYFRNIGGTRRQGAELSLNYRDDRLTAFLSYSYVAASFQSSILVNSPQNVFADASGYIRVRPGDALPGIPSHRIKAGADYHVTPSWLVGAEVIYESDQYFRGDESNQMKPLAGYAIVDLHSSYTLTSKIELFVNVVNALDAHYATFGVLGDPTGIGAPGIPAGSVTNEAGVDNRFESPGPPISAFGGVRIRF
jgi:iron complex outermembrane receptor protein